MPYGTGYRLFLLEPPYRILYFPIFIVITGSRRLTNGKAYCHANGQGYYYERSRRVENPE